MTIFKKKSLVCDMHDPDSMEFLMLATAAGLPEDLTYNPDVKWMQVVHSAFNPVKKYYTTTNGKRRIKEFTDYIAIRIEYPSMLHIQDKETSERWQALPNYIDVWYGDVVNIQTWYFSIPPV